MTARAQCVHPDFIGHVQLLNILVSLFNRISKKSQQVIWERKISRRIAIGLLG
jgi:hypothetical protein